MHDQDEVLAELRVSPLRRVTAVTVMLGLAGVLFYVVWVNPPIAYLQFLFVISGIGALIAARAVAKASAGAVILTTKLLRDRDGTQIAALDEIELVDAGFLALRPSNGFTIRLREPQQSMWRPGLWWRWGRRIGIGGMTPRQSGKMMSDMIKMQIAENTPPSVAGRGD